MHHKISNLAPLNLSNTKILQFPFFALPFARTQAASDITHFYHLDLLHVPRGSLPCVNQNCEGATCKKNGRLQSRGKPTAAWTLIYNHLKLIKSMLSGCVDLPTWGIVVKHGIAHADLQDEGTQ